MVKKLKKKLNWIGSFSAKFNKKYAATCDGVGTKLILIQRYKVHEIAGHDLVAMNANDLLCEGYSPAYFWDYIATGKLDEQTFEKIMAGILKALQICNAELLGGETAEMPGFYPVGVYDLAGFMIGVKKWSFSSKKVKHGDILVGIPSSGFHSNGFSLIRKVIEIKKINLEKDYLKTGKPLWKLLVEPTRIYFAELFKAGKYVKAAAHITGGGIHGNLPRVLPPGAKYKLFAWKVPPLFEFFQREGEIPQEEMFKVFNMGVGMVLVVAPKVADKVCEIVNGFTLGEVLL